MEKSVNFEFRDLMEEMLQFEPVDVSAYSPLVLAYIGDCVYDLIIKSMVINQGNRQVQKLHRETSGYVQASAQSFMRLLTLIKIGLESLKENQGEEDAGK